MEKSTDSSSGSSSSPPSSSGNNAGGGGPSSFAAAQHTTLNPPTSSGGGCSNQATTQHSSDGNHQQQQQHTAQQPTTTMFMQKHQNNSSSTKNQLNSVGCGPSSSAATFANSGNLRASTNGNKNPTANTTYFTSSPSSSLNNGSTTLGHQSCTSAAATTITNATSPATQNASPLSNGVSHAVAITSSSSSMATSTASSSSSSTQMAPINLNISTTTGGNFSVSVDPQITVENLKKIIAKKLKVAKDRICLLHREKELQDGSLKENNLMDGSKIILIPNVETGLLAQRPENTVMQALESLNDSQVNDFLSGKTPLNLSMRLGDHMMLIQLQLSTVNPVNSAAHSGSNCSSSSRTRSSHHHHHHHHRSSSSRGTSTTSTSTQTNGAGGGSSGVTGASAATSTTSAAPAPAPAPAPPNHSHHHHHHHHHHHGNVPGSIATASTTPATVVLPTAQNGTAVRKLELDSSSSCQSRTNANKITSSATAAAPTILVSSQSSSTSRMASVASGPSSAPIASIAVPTKSSDLSSFLSKRDYESLQNIVKSIAMAQPSRLAPVPSTNAAGSTVQSSSSTTPVPSSNIVPVATSFHAPSSAEAVLLEQSPIKSLSNLVSSPIKTTAIKNIPHISNNSNSSSNVNSVALGPHSTAIAAPTAAPASICQDPIAAKLTSCLCTRLNGGSSSAIMPPHATAKQCIETSCMSQQQQQTPQLPLQQLQQQQRTTLMTSTPNYKSAHPGSTILTPPVANGTISSSSSRSSASLHKTAHNTITRKHRHHHHHHHHHHHYHHPAAQSANGKLQPSITSTPTRGISNDSGFNSGDDTLNISTQSPTQTKTPAVAATAVGAPTTAATPVVVAAPLASASSAQSTATVTPIELDESGIVSDSRTLAEASRNLTQTLRKLSKEVFTNKIDFSASEETPRKSGSGAVIESMKNHGKGIYSGTFSGTLNPALQDRYGRPKRDISTVIHILNDLLSATPQYHRGARISFEAPSTSAAAAASVAAASGSSGTIHHSSRSKHLSSKHHHSSHPCVKCIKTHNASLSASNLSAVSTNTTGSLPTASGSGGSSNSISSSSSSICAYGECNGHYVSKSQSSKNYVCCQQDSTNTSNSAISSSSHHHSSHHHHHHQVVDERKVCQCRYRIHTETGEREREHTCQKCATEMDNMKTKSKLDQLRLVMQQRKQKREARKLKGAPYGARVLGATTTAAGVLDATAASTLSASNSAISAANSQPISVASATTTPSEVSPNHIVEEVDTAA